MFKRYLLFILCVVLVFVLCSCGEKSNASAKPSSSEIEKTDVLKLPTEYKDVISDFESIVTYRLSNNFEVDHNNGKGVALKGEWSNFLNASDSMANEELSYRWYCMLVEMSDNEHTKNSFGYVLRDINEDGAPELFWVREDGFILAIFNIQNNKAKLLDAFWSRYKCVISDSNEVWISASGGAADNYTEIKKLNSNSAKFDTIKIFGTESLDNNQNNALAIGYYENINGKKEAITKEKYDELLKKYPFDLGANKQIIGNSLMKIGDVSLP